MFQMSELSRLELSQLTGGASPPSTCDPNSANYDPFACSNSYQQTLDALDAANAALANANAAASSAESQEQSQSSLLVLLLLLLALGGGGSSNG